MSNGGGMAVEIGCHAAGKVAALGSVAGAVVDMGDCQPSRPVPMMAFHGTADPVVSYEGGDMDGWLLTWAAGAVAAPTYFEAAEDWIAAWAAYNGCDPAPESIPPQDDVLGRRYVNCDGEAEVVFYTIVDGGHTWPGGWPIPAVGKTTDAIDATEELWAFYQRYAVPVPAGASAPARSCWRLLDLSDAP
jgi:polyhydroxybutyrate depolymerase